MLSFGLNFLALFVIFICVRMIFVIIFIHNVRIPQIDYKMWKKVTILKVIHNVLIVCLFLSLFKYSLVVFTVLSVTQVLSIVRKKLSKERNRSSFIRDSYKIYHYINQQTESGVRFSDSLVNAHEIIIDDRKSRVFHLFAKHVILRQNVKESIPILSKIYKEEDVGLFAMIVDQELHYGNDSKRLTRFESVMNEKYRIYLNSLQQASKQKMISQSVIALVLFLLSIALPLVTVALSGLTNLLH